MALSMQIKKPWGPSGSPMAPLTMRTGSGARASPAKKEKEEKAACKLHFVPFLNFHSNCLPHSSKMSREKLSGRQTP